MNKAVIVALAAAVSLMACTPYMTHTKEDAAAFRADNHACVLESDAAARAAREGSDPDPLSAGEIAYDGCMRRHGWSEAIR